MYNWREIQGRWGRLFLLGRISIATRNRDRRATEKRISSKRNQSERSWTLHLLPKDFPENFKHSGAICRVHTLPWTLPSASTTSQTRGERRKDGTGRHPRVSGTDTLGAARSFASQPMCTTLASQSRPPESSPAGSMHECSTSTCWLAAVPRLCTPRPKEVRG
jgi:hypothetical protein